MKKTFKYRIYPTKRQETLLKKQLEECRWLYNNTLAFRKAAWEKEKRHASYYETKGRIPELKAERPTLLEVHSQVLQNVTERVELAFQAYFRRIKTGEEPGYPRFKGYGRYDSLTFTQVPSGCKLEDSLVIISKVGHVKAKIHRPMRGKTKTCVISRSSTGKWYACFSCDGVEPNVLSENPNQVGIDVGLKTFASLSNGLEIENPRFFRQEEKELAKVQRKLSQAEKGTPLRTKRRKVVARVYERTRFKRTNFSHQASRKIVNSNGFIAVEDLRINRMVKNRKLSKSISDAAWSAFFTMLSSKAVEAERIFMAVNPAYTSQTCSNCGYRKVGEEKLSLANRIFDCPSCSVVIDRDHNAALNILALGLQGAGVNPVDAPAFTPGE